MRKEIECVSEWGKKLNAWVSEWVRKLCVCVCVCERARKNWICANEERKCMSESEKESECVCEERNWMCVKKEREYVNKERSKWGNTEWVKEEKD